MFLIIERYTMVFYYYADIATSYHLTIVAQNSQYNTSSLATTNLPPDILDSNINMVSQPPLLYHTARHHKHHNSTRHHNNLWSQQYVTKVTKYMAKRGSGGWEASVRLHVVLILSLS